MSVTTTQVAQAGATAHTAPASIQRTSNPLLTERIADVAKPGKQQGPGNAPGLIVLLDILISCESTGEATGVATVVTAAILQLRKSITSGRRSHEHHQEDCEGDGPSTLQSCSRTRRSDG